MLVPPHSCPMAVGPSFSCCSCSRGALWLWVYLVKPNVEPVLAGSAHQHPYLCPLSLSSLNVFLEEITLLCPWLCKLLLALAVRHVTVTLC